MASPNYSFGNYAFNVANGVYAGPYTEMHISQRDLTIMRTVASRGVLLLNGTNQAKMVTVEGVLVGSDADDLTTKARAMAVALMRMTENLIIEKGEDTFVYEGCVLENPESLFGTRYGVNDSHMRFKASFICPKGFARSTTQTIQTTSNIETLPYSGSIIIGGDTDPEPIIEITLVDASSITDLFFANLTTNMQISISGITFVDDDIVKFDTESKQVLLNSNPIAFDGVFPQFTPGYNNFQITASGSGGIVLDQSLYNDEVIFYGNKRIAMSFEIAAGDDISQIELMLKKVDSGLQKVLYDNFNDSSINGALWATSGRVAETGGYLSLTASEGGDQSSDASASTNNKTGDPIYGFSADFSWDGNRGNDSDMYMEITDGTNYIRFQLTHTPDKVHLYLGGSYGSGEVAVWDGNGGNMEVKQNGSNIEIYGSGVLRHTITGDSIEANSYLYILGGANGGGGETIKLNIDNVYIYESVLTNGDITLNIDADSAGEPGSPVASATLTIPASAVGATFQAIINAFSTAPTLTGTTTFHVEVYQSGGDVNNYYVLKVQNTDVYADGNLETSEDGGATWAQVTGKDMYIRMWGAYPTSFNLKNVIKYFASFLNVV